MNLEKIEDFAKIQAKISAGIACLFEAREMIAELMCDVLEFPPHFKENIIADMNESLGIKKI